MAVAHARPDVKIAVIEHGGVATGFFPFQERDREHGEPVAYGISDMQGLICSRDLKIDLRRMLADCGLRSWRFDQLIDGHGDFLRYSWVRDASPYIDISTGFERYRIARHRAGSRLIDQALRKERKLQREHGELRFEFHDTTCSAFDAMVRWKSEQRKRTHSRNVLDDAWVRDVLRRLVGFDSENFGGVLSALYVKDELAAVHFGIRTAAVLHWWFPAYNLGFDRYSPGLVLLVALIRESAARGIQRIDLGKGLERYKYSMMTGITPVAEGGVGYGFIASRCSAISARARQCLRHPRLRGQVTSLKRIFRRRHR
jgi:CelD/BcsL family acetyltransferase involved in cellulose biosynthesis